jgi:hypothetical protein
MCFKMPIRSGDKQILADLSLALVHIGLRNSGTLIEHEARLGAGGKLKGGLGS